MNNHNNRDAYIKCVKIISIIILVILLIVLGISRIISNVYKALHSNTNITPNQKLAYCVVNSNNGDFAILVLKFSDSKYRLTVFDCHGNARYSLNLDDAGGVPRVWFNESDYLCVYLGRTECFLKYDSGGNPSPSASDLDCRAYDEEWTGWKREKRSYSYQWEHYRLVYQRAPFPKCLFDDYASFTIIMEDEPQKLLWNNCGIK